MTTAYTSLLGLALPVTGELSGTWGDVVNNSITSLLDSAIAGTTNVSTDADVTLTTTTGAANTAREAILLFSGARTALRTVTAPAQSKIYTVINATTGGYAVKLVGAGPTTGLTIPNGASATVAWNGSDFIEIGTASIGNLTVNGMLTVTGNSYLAGSLSVGINSTSAKLYVYQDSSSTTAMSGAYIQNSNFTNNSQAGIGFWSGDNFNAKIYTFRSGSSAGSIVFATNGGGGTSESNIAERMRLDSSGRLGLGQTSPVAILDVKGSIGSADAVVYITDTSGTGASSYPCISLRDTGGQRGLVGMLGSNFHINALPASSAILFKTVNTEVARLDSAGNFGLGVVSSAWAWPNGSAGALQLQSGASLSGYNASTYLSQNWYYNGGEKYIGNGYANRYGMYGGGHAWFNAPNNVSGAGATVSWTQAMTLTAGGNLLVGTTDGAMYDTNAGGDVGQYYRFISTGGGGSANYGFTVSNGNSDAAMGLWGVNSASKRLRISAILSQYTNSSAGSEASVMSFSTISSGVLSERARVDSAGFYFYKTSTSYDVNGCVALPGGQFRATASNDTPLLLLRNDSNGTIVSFWRGGVGEVGTISVTTTATAYNTSSDYRLKNVTGALTGYKERLMSLQPKQGTWKVDGSEFRGFLAHDFAVSYRASVTGEKDAVDESGNPIMQAMQASTPEVMADLVAMIKDLVTENESLKARLDAANL